MVFARAFGYLVDAAARRPYQERGCGGNGLCREAKGEDASRLAYAANAYCILWY